MGCAVSQRGTIDDSGRGTLTDVFKNSGGYAFVAMKMGTVTAGLQLYTAFFSMGDDPPFAPAAMGAGDTVDTLDGAPETFGGGGDFYISFTLASGIELDVTPFTYLPANIGGSITDALASTLTTSDYLLNVNHASGNALSWDQISNITTTTPAVTEGTLYHPIFDTPAAAEYYSATRHDTPAHTRGILVAVCLGGIS